MSEINFDAAFEEDKKDEKPSLIIEPELDHKKLKDIVLPTLFDSKLELPKVINSFENVEKQIVAMKTQVKDLKITDAVSFNSAGERLIQCRQITKLIEQYKKQSASYSEAKKLVDDVNKFIRTNFTPAIKEIEDVLGYKIRDYKKAEAEIQRRIAEKRAKEEQEIRRKLIEEEKEKERQRLEKEREEALARQKILDEQAKKAGVDTVKIDIPEIPDEIKIDESAIIVEPVIEESGIDEKIKIEGGTSQMKTKWEVEVIDADKIERQYCEPSMKLLRKAVDAGMKNIEGCRIFEDYKMSTRVSSKNISDAIEKSQKQELPWD